MTERKLAGRIQFMASRHYDKMLRSFLPLMLSSIESATSVLLQKLWPHQTTRTGLHLSNIYMSKCQRYQSMVPNVVHEKIFEVGIPRPVCHGKLWYHANTLKWPNTGTCKIRANTEEEMASKFLSEYYLIFREGLRLKNLFDVPNSFYLSPN